MYYITRRVTLHAAGMDENLKRTQKEAKDNSVILVFMYLCAWAFYASCLSFASTKKAAQPLSLFDNLSKIIRYEENLVYTHRSECISLPRFL